MFRSTFIYLGSSTVNRAIPFLLLPILTRYLTPDQYGMLALFQVCLIFLTPLVDLNISQNIARKFFKLSKDDLAKYVSNILLVLLSSFSIVLALTAGVVLVTDNVLAIPEKWLMVIPVMALMNMVNKCNLVILVQERKPFQFGLFEIGSAIVNTAVSLVLVIGYHQGWQGRSSGLLVTSIVLGIIGFGYMQKRKYVLPSIDLSSVKEILAVSMPTIPHVLGIVLIGFSDRLFVNWLVGTSAVGLYDVGYKIGMITMIVSDAFMRTWSPWFFEKISSNDQDTKLTIVRRSYLFIIGLLLLAGFVTIGAHLVFPYLLDEAFSSADVFVMWIALAYAIRGIYQLMLLYLLHLGRMKFLPLNTSVAVVVNLVLNYYLITANGPVGAAQASLVAFSVMSLGTWWYAHRIHRMPWFSIRSILGWR